MVTLRRQSFSNHPSLRNLPQLPKLLRKETSHAVLAEKPEQDSNALMLSQERNANHCPMHSYKPHRHKRHCRQSPIFPENHVTQLTDTKTTSSASPLSPEPAFSPTMKPSNHHPMQQSLQNRKPTT
ncbi:hypothetical protein KC19_10G173200 [Ceratodon purpureus]|uniref:Uncharacterized protein n=1 Tax=Ceratodon purpureus TaxID=3225 RepID=A0A8T0GN17_CERPU|nr:hypothetical protein KC19_10G173200 [Ceratodon purpureus]